LWYSHKVCMKLLWRPGNAQRLQTVAPCSLAMPAVAPTTDSARPFPPRTSARAMNALHRVLDRNPVWYAASVALMKTPPLYRAFTFVERAVKKQLFGCRMCGQCALPVTAYACPMTCPKQLRNGPCGGVGPDGSCEVYPGMRCVWLMAYERADQEGRLGDLRRLQRPIDQRKWGQSSWVNYWLGEDEGLWTSADEADHAPAMLSASKPAGRSA
jgi:hypothetical protein